MIVEGIKTISFAAIWKNQGAGNAHHVILLDWLYGLHIFYSVETSKQPAH